jgi:hypothetical protein
VRDALQACTQTMSISAASRKTGGIISTPDLMIYRVLPTCCPVPSVDYRSQIDLLGLSQEPRVDQGYWCLSDTLELLDKFDCVLG